MKNRRDVLFNLSAGAALPVVLPSRASANANKVVPKPAEAQWTSDFLNFDPVDQFRHAMRLQRSMYDNDDILHWYHFIMVVVAPGVAPTPIVRWEGIELSRHEKIGDDIYRVHGHNLSFPRDLDTGEFVDAVVNPVTGKTVKPGFMALTGDPGYIASPKGTIALDNLQGSLRKKYGVIRREGEFVKIDGIRVPPATWPVTFLEMGYESAPAEFFDDSSQLWLPTDVSGAYVFPYPEWMEMGDAPGHMFAAWSGYKLRTADQLPVEYIARAKRDRPDLLEVDRAQFANTIDLSGIFGDKS